MVMEMTGLCKTIFRPFRLLTSTRTVLRSVTSGLTSRHLPPRDAVAVDAKWVNCQDRAFTTTNADRYRLKGEKKLRKSSTPTRRASNSRVVERKSNGNPKLCRPASSRREKPVRKVKQKDPVTPISVECSSYDLSHGEKKSSIGERLTAVSMWRRAFLARWITGQPYRGPVSELVMFQCYVAMKRCRQFEAFC